MNTENLRENVNILKFEPLVSPKELKKKLPVSEACGKKVVNDRISIQNVLEHNSEKFLVIVGPCSIHNHDEAIEYAHRLKELNDKVSEKLILIMRVYFEKPRTILGWKGLIYDPDLDGTCNIVKGLEIARKLLIEIDEIGLPTATEILDPVTAEFIVDLISWAAIGARTTESQTHRQLVSGLSMPVGFKNTTDGSIKTAVEAVKAAQNKHVFLGLLEDGRNGIFHTKGNRYAHLVLRGGITGPNYSSENIAYAKELMKNLDIIPNIIVDCSHANSKKKAVNQKLVIDSIIEQKINGQKYITGVMLESNLKVGKQKVSEKNSLDYGVSITDECIGWEETEDLIKKLSDSL